jgi:hypothetical protein
MSELEERAKKRASRLEKRRKLEEEGNADTSREWEARAVELHEILMDSERAYVDPKRVLI